MTKKQRLLITNICLFISIVILAGWLIYTEEHSKRSTIQTHSNIPGADRGIAVIETKHGDIMTIGFIKDNPTAPGDILLICFDKTGKKKWTETYGGNWDDTGCDLLEVPGGGFLLAGTTSNENLDSGDMLAIRINSLGKEIWKRSYGTKRKENCWDMTITQDGNYLLVGETTLPDKYGKGNQDFYAVKIDPHGKKIWSQTYGGKKSDRCFSIDTTGDGYILLGSTNSFGAGDQDAYLLKVDTDGNEQWSQTYGSEKFDMGNDVKCIWNTSYIVIGYTETASKGKNDAWIFKTDLKGKKIWETTIGGADDDRTIRGIQTFNGNYLMTGYTKSYGAGFWDLFLVNIDRYGRVIWKKNHSGKSAGMGYGIFEALDGSILITGQTYSHGNHHGDLLLLKTNKRGEIN